MLDYLKSTASSFEGTTTIRIEPLWQLLLATLAPVWPARLTLNGEPLGDVWPCCALATSLDQQGITRVEGDDYVPFHKLSQWLCYSLIQPMEEVAGWKVEGWKTLMTGLPEASTTITTLSFHCVNNNYSLL
ncbi:hypothetical protein QFC24_001057 [Naganishia onofrii]|uniref:Uncharacterized protein n=1 Tax=Naganishia onofrii TaxID=1851511 RepID=A0ACC2XWK8_9TREE|nr:hypothetical protein QFC24_001057 [Naganishia onofrii]